MVDFMSVFVLIFSGCFVHVVRWVCGLVGGTGSRWVSRWVGLCFLFFFVVFLLFLFFRVGPFGTLSWVWVRVCQCRVWCGVVLYRQLRQLGSQLSQLRELGSWIVR